MNIPLAGLIVGALALLFSLLFNYLQYKWRKEERERHEQERAEQQRKERMPPEFYNLSGTPHPIRITGSQHSERGPFVDRWGFITVVNPTQFPVKITPLRLVINGVEWEATKLAFHLKADDRERYDRISLVGNHKQDYALESARAGGSHHRPSRSSPEFSPLPANFHYAPYVPGLAMAERDDLLIHHSGYGSCQTGLYTGTPFDHPDVFRAGKQCLPDCRRWGLADSVSPTSDDTGRNKRVSAYKVRAKVFRILWDSSYRENAMKVRERLRAFGGAPEAARLIEALPRKERRASLGVRRARSVEAAKLDPVIPQRALGSMMLPSVSLPMAKVARPAPNNWEQMNLAAVIETNVIDGHPGLPTVVAAETW